MQQAQIVSHGSEYCRSSALYSSLHALKIYIYQVTQGLEKLQLIHDQDVFAAYNLQWVALTCPDYRAENIQQLKETLLQEFSQACEALEGSLLHKRDFIRKAKVQEIQGRTQDCLALLGSIKSFAEYGCEAHRLQASKG